ncbi:MAG TPA: AraC family transcriptional regulator [Chitinophagaceae bacterium]
MISKDFTPSPLLYEFISSYRLRHFVFNGLIKPSFKPFPPRPEQCLIFYPRGKEIAEYLSSGEKIERPRSVISGQFTERINRYVTTPEFLMIAVDLKPGALHRLTGIPFSEFTNKCMDAEDIFPAEMRMVNERLANAKDYAEMISIIETFCLSLTKRSKKEILAVDHLLQSLVQEPAMQSLDSLSKKAYLSARQLERKFDERIGVSPKTFLKITRFNQSYWMRLKQPKLDWLSIAVSCGYSDYQHLAKEYKAFANATPNSFFDEETNAPGRALGLTK